MWESRSIFTGNDTTTPLDTKPDDNTLNTIEHREFVVKTPGHPPARLDPPFEFLEAQAPWTPRSPLNHREVFPRPGSAPLHRRRPHSGTQFASTPPTVVGIKRPPPPSADDAPTPTSQRLAAPASEPLHKRRKAHPRARYSLDRFAFSRSAQPRLGGEPLSPLFFSSGRTRPELPARFSSSEAAARMLSKTREDSGIKTVTLARGTFNGLSPPGPTAAASGRSSERSSLPRTASPDSREKNDPLRVLASIGIVELLEQDGRPTFIVDIGDFANYAPDSSRLQILFANNALRASASTWELVAGQSAASTPEDSTAHATQQFRAWLLSIVLQGGNTDVNPSPVEYGGIAWSCYTLRKRLRVVSGVVSAPALHIPSAKASNEFAIPSTPSVGQVSGNGINSTSSSVQANEAQDYFGSSTAPAPPQGEPTPPTSAPQPDPTYDKIGDTAKEAPPKLPPRINIPPMGESTSFANECVLRAHTAGDVDSFHRETNGLGEEGHDMGFFDWTRLAMSPSLPKHIQFARSIDWASTPLGPIEYWSNDLRAMCNLIMWV